MTNERKTILIVDDTQQNLDVLVGLLKGSYRVKVARDGELAMKIVSADEPPDLILLDIMMPVMDGFEVCRRLKADPERADIPVIFISALSETADKVKAFTAGGVDYISKPFQVQEVEARVATHLKLREQQLQIKAQKHLLQENYDRLRELEELRDNLVHMIVHDMRSPLMGINGMLEILKMQLEESLSEDLIDEFDEALTAGHTLQDMISSLLDISRMEAGRMPLLMNLVDLRNVVSSALTSLGALLRQCRVIFEPPVGEAFVMCDPELIRRVIANLVANAIKFTPSDGRVRIDISQEADRVKVSVWDTGPGIAPEHREKIFQKFGQVELRQEGRNYSSGLGLTFCKMAIDAHSGEIGLESEVGKGSTFWFTLPGGDWV